MPRKRKVNMPLIEVLLISAAFHLLVIFAFGGYIIYQGLTAQDVTFTAPPPAPTKTKPKIEQAQVRVQQTQRNSSSRPRQTLTARSVSTINVPQVQVQVPTVEVRVAAAVGGARGNVATNLGTGRIGMDISKVNFFDIKSEGERVTFIIDVSRYMMEDQKGGMNAYRIVKEEIINIVNGLNPSTLFNVILYDYPNTITVFKPEMIPASTPNKEAFAAWLRPLNEDPSKLGATIGTGYKIQQPFEPILNGISRRWKAIQAAFEMKTDAVFFITGGWEPRLLQPYPEGFDIREWRAKNGWTDEKQKAWEDAVKRARDWLEAENKARAAKGMPPKVVQHIITVMRQDLKDNTPAPIEPRRQYWEEDELTRYFQRLGRFLYEGERIPSPEINVIIFLGKDENWTPTQDEQVKKFTSRNRGKYRMIQGLEGIKSVTGQK